MRLRDVVVFPEATRLAKNGDVESKEEKGGWIFRDLPAAPATFTGPQIWVARPVVGGAVMGGSFPF